MVNKYQAQDLEICDSELYALQGFRDLLRGPRPNSLSDSDTFIAYLDAAQTFDALCRYPFPNLLSSMLGVESLKLSIGSAGSRRFPQNPAFRNTLIGHDAASYEPCRAVAPRTA